MTEPIKKFVSKSGLALPIALIIPEVKVKFSPNGLPIAIAWLPTLTIALSPRDRGLYS